MKPCQSDRLLRGNGSRFMNVKLSCLAAAIALVGLTGGFDTDAVRADLQTDAMDQSFDLALADAH